MVTSAMNMGMSRKAKGSAYAQPARACAVAQSPWFGRLSGVTVRASQRICCVRSVHIGA
jgi:hypothetical protein